MNKNLLLVLVFLGGVILADKVRSIPILDKLPTF